MRRQAYILKALLWPNFRISSRGSMYVETPRFTRLTNCPHKVRGTIYSMKKNLDDGLCSETIQMLDAVANWACNIRSKCIFLL
jgi:hypothetical protein